MIDKTGNHRLRAPTPPVTRSMADAGIEKLYALMKLDTPENPVGDDAVVAEVFIAMWCVMQEQAMKAREMARKGMDANNVLVMPHSGILRPQ